MVSIFVLPASHKQHKDRYTNAADILQKDFVANNRAIRESKDLSDVQSGRLLEVMQRTKLGRNLWQRHFLANKEVKTYKQIEERMGEYVAEEKPENFTEMAVKLDSLGTSMLPEGAITSIARVKFGSRIFGIDIEVDLNPTALLGFLRAKFLLQWWFPNLGGNLTYLLDDEAFTDVTDDFGRTNLSEKTAADSQSFTATEFYNECAANPETSMMIENFARLQKLESIAALRKKWCSKEGKIMEEEDLTRVFFPIGGGNIRKTGSHSGHSFEECYRRCP